jgi:thiol:disulfide interchange protein
MQTEIFRDRLLIGLLLVVTLWATVAAGQSSPLLSLGPTEAPDPVTLSTAWSVDRAGPGDSAVLAVVLSIQEGYHVIADAGQVKETKDFKPFPTRVRPTAASGGLIAESPRYPPAKPLKAEFIDSPIASFEGRAIVYLPVRVDAASPPGTASILLEVQYQACSAASCLMPRREMREAVLAVASAGQKSTAVHPEIFADWAQSKEATGIRFEVFGWGFTLDAASIGGWMLLLVVAGAGGFLLNFTPCVLPLVPIKLISLSNAAAADRRRCLSLGLFAFAGVIAFWVSLGGIVSMVSDFTSTNQLFQYPAFTIGVGLIIAAMAIGMFGVYSVRLPGFIYALNPRQETPVGALCVGVLTAVLSTPCTAPFMGTAAAWAATQKPGVTIVTFAAIGAGMGLPSLLAAFPRLVRRLPRAGPGSELLKQAMAIVMLAAAVYFIGVGIGTLRSEPATPAGQLHWWPVMILCAAAGAWAGLRAFVLSSGKRSKAFWAALGTAIVGLSLYSAVRLTDTGPIEWTAYTPERLARAFKDHKTVVMVFTAEWCLNCKALEQSVWRDPELAKLASRPGVIAMKADLTGSNTDGREKLREAGSLTIPLLVVYTADGRPIFKSDFYTTEQVMTAIGTALAESRPAAS